MKPHNQKFFGLLIIVVLSLAISGCGGGGGGSSSSDTTGGTTTTDPGGTGNDTGGTGGTTTIIGTVSPAVVSKSTDGSSGAVDTGAAISVTFNEDMNASTITASTFTVSGASGTVTYDSTAKKATFTPSSTLAYSTAYTATITTGVKDTSGNAMANSFSWSFTTKDPTPATPYLMGGAIQGNPLNPNTNVVTTLAGTAGSSGSTDGTGSAARFYLPYGITTDGTNLYVADYNNHTIRKIAISTGAVTTIAGSASSIGSTDGTGTSAKFGYPYGITTDGANLYVADGNSLRKIVISTGVVTTITITGSSFYAIRHITTDGTNLYVADFGSHTIRKVVISTGVVTTVAGSIGSTGSTDGTGTAARFNYPSGITTDGTNLYVADSSNHTIRKVVISTGAVTTVAGGIGSTGSTDGTGTAARFDHPDGITTDGTNLYVADAYNSIIRKIAISTGVVTTVVGSAGVGGSTDGTGTAAKFYYPYGITIDGTNLYVADSGNYTIRKISALTTAPSSSPGNVTATAGNGYITIYWDSVSGATCYNLYCAEGTSVTTTTGTKIPYIASPYQLGGYWTATPITNGTTYSCIVTAVNDYGEGPASTQTSSTPSASHTLSISKSGTGSGTVTSTPSGMDCGSTCTASVTTDTTVTLTATAASGSTFDGWSGGGCSGTGSCTVTMDSDKTVTATFNSPFTLSVSKSGSGTVSSSPSGISCGSDCSSSFTSGSTVTLTATPASGYTFTGWSGACSGTGSCVVTMSSDKSVTATFTTSSGGGGGSSTYYWANWSCTSSACTSVMGASNGSTGQFCTLSDCEACTTSGCIGIYGASCSTTATYATHTATADNGICLQSGVDF